MSYRQKWNDKTPKLLGGRIRSQSRQYYHLGANTVDALLAYAKESEEAKRTGEEPAAETERGVRMGCRLQEWAHLALLEEHLKEEIVRLDR